MKSMSCTLDIFMEAFDLGPTKPFSGVAGQGGWIREVWDTFFWQAV